jgi:SP family sugar:H+ symporter-like MFS transporter
MIYETKGLTLEQVDELYGIVSSARKSKTFRPQVSFADVDHEGQRHMSLAEIASGQERKRSVQHDEVLPMGHSEKAI